MRRYSIALLFVGLGLIITAESARVNTGKRRQLQSGGNVSIYDGVLPSPDLGPRPPPPAANTTAARAATERVTVSGGHHCSAGCVAGSVIGSVVGVALLAVALFFCCRRSQRMRTTEKGERTLSQIDLLASGEARSQPDPKVKAQTFCAGNPVFCQMGKCCASGDVIDAEGEEYRVRLFDGSEKTIKDGSLAMNFKEGDAVLYTPPKGGESIAGTIIASNGNFWPPFYQLQPKNSSEGTINTTAECLQPAR